MSTVDLVVESGKAEIVLRRPEVLNAMNFEVFDDLTSAAQDVARREEVRVVKISGEGRSFSSGIDVGALGSGDGTPTEMIARAQAGFRAIASLPMPTVAVVQGHAYGAGLQLALACDLRVVASDARLGLLEARYGLIPDLGGSTLLPRLVGPARAKKMIWLGETVTGDEAGAIGLADIVSPPEALASEGEALCDALHQAPRTPAHEAKALIDRHHLVDVQEGMDAEAAAQERCMTSADFAETLMRGLQERVRGRD
jgi:enoyl-CoA hydratase/carnithine racemase